MMKKFKVTLTPCFDLQDGYEVAANSEEDAIEEAFEMLEDAIGRDAAKDWEVSD